MRPARSCGLLFASLPSSGLLLASTYLHVGFGRGWKNRPKLTHVYLSNFVIAYDALIGHNSSCPRPVADHDDMGNSSSNNQDRNGIDQRPSENRSRRKKYVHIAGKLLAPADAAFTHNVWLFVMLQPCLTKAQTEQKNYDHTQQKQQSDHK